MLLVEGIYYCNIYIYMYIPLKVAISFLHQSQPCNNLLFIIFTGLIVKESLETNYVNRSILYKSKNGEPKLYLL